MTRGRRPGLSLARETIWRSLAGWVAETMVYVLATLIVRPEKRADFLENARTVIAATRKEAGCRIYDLTSSITEPNEFVFVELWDSRAALEAHFGTSHVREWRRISAEFVERGRIEIIHPDKVETL